MSTTPVSFLVPAPTAKQPHKRRSNLDETEKPNLKYSKGIPKVESAEHPVLTYYFQPVPSAFSFTHTPMVAPLLTRDVEMVEKPSKTTQKTISVTFRRDQEPSENPQPTSPPRPAAADKAPTRPEEKSDQRVWKFEKPLEPKDFSVPTAPPAQQPSPIITLGDGSTIQRLPNGMMIQRLPDGKISVTGLKTIEFSNVSPRHPPLDLRLSSPSPSLPRAPLFGNYPVADTQDGEFEGGGSDSENEAEISSLMSKAHLS